MPRKCCVPGCKSNYDSTIKLKGAVSTFTFPKEETRKQAWIRAIARKNWHPSPSSTVCAHHFDEKDIRVYENWKQSDGTVTQLALRLPRLKEEAVPKKFPNLPSYMAFSTPVKRRYPDSRRAAIRKRKQQQEQINTSDTDVKDIPDLQEDQDANDSESSERTSQDPLSGRQDSPVTSDLVECKQEPEDLDETDVSSSDQQLPEFETSHTSKRPRIEHSIKVEEQEVFPSPEQVILPNPEQVCVKMERDRFDIFGELVAYKLRHLSSEFLQNKAEHLISQILFQASEGEFDESPTGSSSTL